MTVLRAKRDKHYGTGKTPRGLADVIFWWLNQEKNHILHWTLLCEVCFQYNTQIKIPKGASFELWLLWNKSHPLPFIPLFSNQPVSVCIVLGISHWKDYIISLSIFIKYANYGSCWSAFGQFSRSPPLTMCRLNWLCWFNSISSTFGTIVTQVLHLSSLI